MFDQRVMYSGPEIDSPQILQHHVNSKLGCITVITADVM